MLSGIPKKSFQANTTAEESTSNTNQRYVKDHNVAKQFSSINELYKKHPPLKTSQLNERDNNAQQTKTYHNKLLRSEIVFRSAAEQETTAVQGISGVGVLSAMDRQSRGVFFARGCPSKAPCW